MTTSKKAAQPKPDTTAPAQSGETQPEPLPAAAVAEAQALADTPVEQQDAAPQPSDAELASVGAESMDASEPTKEPRFRITARHPNGFWRCGRQWHPAGEVLTLSEIGGEAVLATLRLEPMLIVALEQ